MEPKKTTLSTLHLLPIVDLSPEDPTVDGQPYDPVRHTVILADNRLVAKPTPPATRSIAISYELITPESAEAGDAEERGWIDEEGVSMEPDANDVEGGLNAVDLAVAYLFKHGATETSSEPPGGLDTWGIASDYRHHYDTGAVENRHFFLRGFTDEEARAIWTRIRRH
jgi:hypothetical protein